MTDAYANLAEGFDQHGRTVRAQVRYRLVHRALREAGLRGRRVLDHGGGAGRQSLRLLTDGIAELDIYDPSHEMRRKAMGNLSQLPVESRSKVSVLAAPPQGTYDLTLSHGVLPYVDDVDAYLHELASLTDARGIVSVLFKNADALAMRAGLRGDYETALELFDATSSLGSLGVTTRAHRRSDITATMQGLGFIELSWHSVRVFTDHLDDEMTVDDLEACVEAEWAAGRTDPYRHVGRLSHVLFTRR